tara:strand:- start:126 stop:323 length:198 start_codon:yes stop_codon:yes gene_type:complete
MHKFPLPEQAIIKLDSRELEEINSALMPLNSLVNAGLPMIKKRALLTPTPLFSAILLTYEGSRLN